jgi:hypothetical protein
MSTTPARETERNCRDPYGRNLGCAGDDVCCFPLGGTPQDLAGQDNPKSAIHACTKRHRHQGASTNQYSRRVHRRQQCMAVLKIPGTARPDVARYVTGSLASSVTTAGEPQCVRGNAPTASGPVRTTTEDGCADFQLPPDNSNGAHRTPPPSAHQQFDALFCFAPGNIA